MSEQTELVDDKIQDEGKQTFKTAAFEGPLDLLLFLIQKSEINIYDIPISQITEQFLDYLKNVKEGELDLNAMSDFYKMAADLIYIKSRMLLPVEVDYDEEYEDPRQELVDRLLDYQKFKKYTELLTGGATDGQIYVERKKADFLIPFDDQELFEGVDLSLLREAFLQLMAKKNMSKVFNVYETVTVNEKLTLMMELFETKEKITLLDVIIFPDKIMHVICSFMAILEGCKFRMIRIMQEKPFDTIYIWKKKSDTLSDEEADEIDEMYEESIEKGYYTEQEIYTKEDNDDFTIQREVHGINDTSIDPTTMKDVNQNQLDAEKEQQKATPSEVSPIIEQKKPKKEPKETEEIEGIQEDIIGVGDFEDIDLDADDDE